MNKARGGDGISVALFQILKDDAVKVLYSICQQIWKTQPWPQNWKRSVFIPIPKKGNAKECSNYHMIALISHANKVMLKILQDIEKAREFQKNIYFCFIAYTKAFDCVDHNKLWEILQEMEIKRCLTPWKESYDQPRQHIKKQRHYFVNKGPSSQVFSSGHVWM